jgi:hypothetical protein
MSEDNVLVETPVVEVAAPAPVRNLNRLKRITRAAPKKSLPARAFRPDDYLVYDVSAAAVAALVAPLSEEEQALAASGSDPALAVDEEKMARLVRFGSAEEVAEAKKSVTRFLSMDAPPQGAKREKGDGAGKKQAGKPSPFGAAAPVDAAELAKRQLRFEMPQDAATRELFEKRMARFSA